MLLLFRKLNQLNFGKLMELYGESNRENAEQMHAGQPLYAGMLLVEQDFHQYLREVFFPVDGAMYWVLTEGDTYVSALRLEPYKDGVLLEALETHPDYRQKGYAVMLILQVLEELKKQGFTAVYSHVHKKNGPSLAVHVRCGFQRISEQAVYIDGNVNSRACTFCYRLN